MIGHIEAKARFCHPTQMVSVRYLHDMADRDEITRFCDELLDVKRFRDYGPMGLQVEGSAEVERIICGVSASLELFDTAATRGAQMILVHHGIFWNNERLLIDRRQKGRLKVLFDCDISLLAYHLALDAHPEIGNAALLAQELGIVPERAFDEYGVGGRLEEPIAAKDFVTLVEKKLGRKPTAYLHGPESVRRVAILTGGGGHSLLPASREGYDLFLTGEATEPALHLSRELGIHFIAAGHYATEKLGIQALTGRIAERFGVQWDFIDIPNPV